MLEAPRKFENRLLGLTISFQLECAQWAFATAMLVATAGFRAFENRTCRGTRRSARRFSVIRELGGHGIGRTLHELPHVPNYLDRSANQVLTEGMVITVEPIIAAGKGEVSVDLDGWSVRTVDGRPSAHYEHTLIITRGRPILLTAART